MRQSNIGPKEARLLSQAAIKRKTRYALRPPLSIHIEHIFLRYERHLSLEVTHFALSGVD